MCHQSFIIFVKGYKILKKPLIQNKSTTNEKELI